MTGERKATVAIAILASMFLSSAATGEDVAPDLRESIRELMEITGSIDLGEQMGTAMAQQLLSSMHQTQPDIPDEVVQIVSDVTVSRLQAAIPELIERVVPLYARYLSREDVEGLLAFYKTPLGQKTIEVMPALMQESMQLGVAWAQEQMPRVRAELSSRLEAAGYVK